MSIGATPVDRAIRRRYPFAAAIAAEATGEAPEEPPSDKNPHAVALGRLGGMKGGKARAKKLTPEQRREIARKAAAARWRHER